MEVGGPVKDATVSFFIRGEDLDPNAITGLLGIEPDWSAVRGYQKSPRYRPLDRGFWALRREIQDGETAEAALESMVARLPADPELWKDLSSRYSIEAGFGVFLDEWNRGFDLSPSLVRRLSELGASFGCDIYAPDDSESDV